MEKAKVYFTDFHTVAFGDGLPTKLQKLVRRAGIADLQLDGKFVAIKMHFGELGNISYLRPNYARAIVDVVKELGGKPFLTDCNTMYPGSRKNALEHLECAWQNGFTPLTVGCPISSVTASRGRMMWMCRSEMESTSSMRRSDGRSWMRMYSSH